MACWLLVLHRLNKLRHVTLPANTEPPPSCFVISHSSGEWRVFPKTEQEIEDWWIAES